MVLADARLVPARFPGGPGEGQEEPSNEPREKASNLAASGGRPRAAGKPAPGNPGVLLKDPGVLLKNPGVL